MSSSKTIKISKENYEWLLKIASRLQPSYGRPVSFDETINSLKSKKKKKLSDLAGSWKISNKNAEVLLDDIYSSRNASSRRL